MFLGREPGRPPRSCARRAACGRLSSAWPLFARLDLLLASHCALGSAPAACVGPRALAAHRQASAMPLAAIGADLGQALDVHRDLPAQATFDEDGFPPPPPIDNLAQARQLFPAPVPCS